ncbi:MAG: calcium/sodium antiporter, partial [Pseudomonadales bacterium]|nr:calcium/sodium antiporter [Pseudomonadales bacterium]
MNMLWPLIALGAGILLLIFSADRFVGGAAATSKQLGLPPLLIGMLVIGFGSSMPEMVISSLAAVDGNPGLALGNAFGSNISNIALILGTTAIIAPVAVESAVIHRELPFLIGLTVVIGLLLIDAFLSLYDGIVLISLFCVLMIWSIRAGLKSPPDHLAEVIETELEESLNLRSALLWMFIGLILLVISSRLLVWGGVA